MKIEKAELMNAFDCPRFNAFTAAIGHSSASVARMKVQAKRLFQPYTAQIQGARVLDVGAGAGHWSAFAACAGAAEVVALDARASHAADFAKAADGAFDDVRYVVGEMIDVLQGYQSRGESFDIVLLFGVLFHTADHSHLLRHVMAVTRDLLLLDSEISQLKGSAILVATEPTDDPRNAPGVDGAARALVGVPTQRALEVICSVIGAEIEWHDWGDVSQDERPLVAEYCREDKIIRKTLALRPSH